MLHYQGNFPTAAGWVLNSSEILETDDLPGADEQWGVHSMRCFAFNDDVVLTCVELPPTASCMYRLRPLSFHYVFRVFFHALAC